MKDRVLALPRSAKKYWGGFAPHPFLLAIAPMLAQRGYLLSKNLGEGQILTWSRVLFRENYAFISLLPGNMSKKDPSLFGVTPVLGVKSFAQRNVQTLLRTWECENLRPGSFVTEPEDDVIIFRAFLDWLSNRWANEVSPPIVPLAGRWDRLDTNRAEDAAVDMISVLDHQGEDFFSYIGSPEKLANALLDPYGFPGRREGEFLDVSPTGVKPEEYAAVLLARNGQEERAKQVIQGSLQRIEKLVELKRAHEQDIHVQKCKIERYMRWIETGMLPSHPAFIQA